MVKLKNTVVILETLLYNITRMVKRSNASNSIFSKKVFMVGEKDHKLTPIFKFFTSPTKFAIKPTKKVVHKCMICGKTIQAEFGYSSNINHHLINYIA